MATTLPTSLTRYVLTDTEQFSGQLLTLQNKQVLQNLLAESCEKKLSLTFDEHNPVKFAQESAYEHGQMDIIKYILECAEQAEQEILLRAREDAQNQEVGGPNDFYT